MSFNAMTNTKASKNSITLEDCENVLNDFRSKCNRRMNRHEVNNFNWVNHVLTKLYVDLTREWSDDYAKLFMVMSRRMQEKYM